MKDALFCVILDAEYQCKEKPAWKLSQHLLMHSDLLGFGAETLMRKETRKEPDMCFVSYNGKEDKTKHFNDNGMRHRSCYHFCDMVEGTVGIIFSHDDVIKACTKHNGKVIVYDHVVLPLL